MAGELADVCFLTRPDMHGRDRGLLRHCQGRESQQRSRREVHPLQAMFLCAHGGLQSSENKIEAQEQTAAGNVQASGRNAALAKDGIFIVERETIAAGNKWVGAVAEGQYVNVAQITG